MVMARKHKQKPTPRALKAEPPVTQFFRAHIFLIPPTRNCTQFHLLSSVAHVGPCLPRGESRGPTVLQGWARAR